jgi:hypothetical protein
MNTKETNAIEMNIPEINTNIIITTHLKENEGRPEEKFTLTEKDVSFKLGNFEKTIVFTEN